MENNKQLSLVVTPKSFSLEQILQFKSKMKSTSGTEEAYAHFLSLSLSPSLPLSHSLSLLFVGKVAMEMKQKEQRHRGATEMAIINLKH